MNMRKIVMALTAFLLISVVASSQNPPAGGSLVIKGNVTGLTTGTASVTTEVFSQKKTFDAPIAGGKFEVRITQPSPTLYSLVIKEDPAGRVLFFADNGILQIDAVKGSLANAKISGSVSNKEFSQYNYMVESFDGTLKSIQQVYAEWEQTSKLVPKKRDSLEYIFNVTMYKKDSSIQAWVRTHSKSYVSPLVMILNYGNDGDPKIMRPLFDGLPTEVKQSYYGNFLEGILARKEGLSVGKLAPAFSQANTQGKPVSLESFKGKYVLVDFWASWCPCRQENPNLVRTYEKFKSKNLEILGVSLDNSKDKWLQAIEEDQLHWPHVSDLKGWRNDVALQYGVQSIPANFLLDKDGKIIAKGLRGAALEQALEQLLK
jgi:peroxiredoxin